METMAIYRINEKNRTIDIARSVINNDEDIQSAMLNARQFGFDEMMRQHETFRNNTEILDTFRDRLLNGLRVGKSIEVNTDDMTAKFVAEHGENIFFRAFVTTVIDLYNEERRQLTHPVDRVKMEFSKRKIQDTISAKINICFDETLKILCSETFFCYNSAIERFNVQNFRAFVSIDEYTFSVFHESDSALVTLLFEIGQIVHRNKWTICECGFCHKKFLGTENEVCCLSVNCLKSLKQQEKKISDEHTREYSDIKRNYDSVIRGYKKRLVDAGIEKYYPIEFDRFIEEKELRADKMTAEKKRLKRNALPSDSLFALGERFKAEMKAITDDILDKYENK